MNEANALGITSLQTSSTGSGHDRLFELHALDKGGHEVASIRLRVGDVEGLVAGWAEPGSELVVTVHDKDMRMATYAQDQIVLATNASPNLETEQFLKLGALRSVLEREAGVIVQMQPSAFAQEVEYTTAFASACNPGYLLVDPIANQCCQRNWAGEGDAMVISNAEITNSASNYGNDPPQRASDGLMSTRFSTDAAMSPGMWFKAATVNCYNFEKIIMDSGPSTGDYARGYQVFVSLDGTNWGAAVATGTGTGQVITVPFTPKPGKFIKVVQTGSAGNWWSIAEFQALGKDCSDIPKTDPYNNIAWTATGYAADGTQVPNYDAYGNPQWGGLAIDTSTSTRFSTGTAQANGQALLIDFGECKKVNRVVMDSGTSTGDYAHGYQVKMSLNNSSWTTVKTGTCSTQVVDTGLFTSFQGRYLKIVQTGSSGNWWSIHDLHIYGTNCAVDNGQNTIFIRPTDGANIMRARNPTGEGCKGYYGEPCSGAACYYGPFGFGVASVFTYPGYPYGVIDQQFCNPSFYATPQPTYWGNVTGTNPRGQGCPTGSGMSLPVWDY